MAKNRSIKVVSQSGYNYKAISTEKIAIALGVSSKTIKRHIKEMYNVSYIGRGFSGHWEIKDDE